MNLELDEEWEDETQQTHILASKELERLAARHSDAGYREGITAGKAATLQEGFNQGFADASAAARRLGQARGTAAALLAWLLERKSSEATLIEQCRALIRDLGRLTIDDVLERDEAAMRHAAEHGEDLPDAMSKLAGSEPRATLQDCEARLQSLLSARGR